MRDSEMNEVNSCFPKNKKKVGKNFSGLLKNGGRDARVKIKKIFQGFPNKSRDAIRYFENILRSF